jgi:hypothetical protein
MAVRRTTVVVLGITFPKIDNTMIVASSGKFLHWMVDAFKIDTIVSNIISFGVEASWMELLRFDEVESPFSSLTFPKIDNTMIVATSGKFLHWIPVLVQYCTSTVL